MFRVWGLLSGIVFVACGQTSDSPENDRNGIASDDIAGDARSSHPTPMGESMERSAPGSVSTELDEFTKDYIEAVFLGTGPLVPRDGFTACVTNPGRWASYPRGTRVDVVLSRTLDKGGDGVDTVQLVQAALRSVEQATLGAITTTVRTTSEDDPIPTPGQATATDHPNPVDAGCPLERGCVLFEFTDAQFTVIESARVVLKEEIQPADAFVHDLVGHGIMGMCHVDQMLVGGNDKSLMAGGPGSFSGMIPDGLSALDMAAARAVFSSGLKPGASRAEFLDAGLVNP